MARCNKCGRVWPLGNARCPDDGSALSDDIASLVALDDAASGVTMPLLSNPSEDDLPAGTQVGEYRVEGKLGEGGMGAVFSAVHPLIGKQAAIKVLGRDLSNNKTAVERFILEARAVNRICHPNIIDVFSFGQLVDGRSYFVMEWLKGQTLEARLQRGRPPLVDALDWLDQICRALLATHEKGIIHRDLKPANIFLMEVPGERPLVKLLDFGIAKLNTDEQRATTTRAGLVLGTPNYLSPEQARGVSVDARTDIYALGVVMFEVLLGRLPFVANAPIEVMVQHVSDAPPRPSTLWPQIPSALDELLLRMLSKDAAARPSLQEVRATIAPLISQPAAPPVDLFAPPPLPPALALATAAPAPDPPVDEPRPKRRFGRLAIAVASTVVIFAAAGVLRHNWRTVGAKLAQVVPFAPTLFGSVEADHGAPPQPMTLVLTVDTPHASLIIDDHRVELGKSNGVHVQLESLKEHRLSVTAPGHRSFHKTFSAGSGEVLRIAADLR